MLCKEQSQENSEPLFWHCAAISVGFDIIQVWQRVKWILKLYRYFHAGVLLI